MSKNRITEKVIDMRNSVSFLKRQERIEVSDIDVKHLIEGVTCDSAPGNEIRREYIEEAAMDLIENESEKVIDLAITYLKDDLEKMGINTEDL